MNAPTGPRLVDRYGPQATFYRAMFGLDARETLLQEAIGFACLNGVEGDYLEFGTYAGASFIHAYWAQQSFIQQHRPIKGVARFQGGMVQRAEYRRVQHAIAGTRFIAFDSFQGLPSTMDPDEQLFGAGDYACTEEQFRANLEENEVDMERVCIVPGWFKDTLNGSTRTELGLHQASVVHIDCDLYEPTALVLSFVTDLVVDGTILLFDDWELFRGHPERGQQRAFREWSARHPHLKFSNFRAFNAFIVHR